MYSHYITPVPRQKLLFAGPLEGFSKFIVKNIGNHDIERTDIMVVCIFEGVIEPENSKKFSFHLKGS